MTLFVSRHNNQPTGMSVELEEAVTDTSFYADAFRSDNTVPSGWSFKGTLASGKRFVLQCPQGYQYRSRSDAFEKMIISGRYSDNDIFAMKSCLKHEGWEDTEALPEGWKLKRGTDSKFRTLVMEQGGRRFNSATKALEFVNTHSKYYTKDVFDKLNLISQNSKQRADKGQRDVLKIAETRTLHQENIKTDPNHCSLQQTPPINEIQKKERDKGSCMKWKSDETLYPSGWMFGTENSKRALVSFKSPEGSFFKSSTRALRFMIESKYPESEILKMRRAMQQEGWEEKDSLPEGWLFRKRKNGKRTMRNEFCDSQGRYLRSGAEILTYSKFYTQDVVEKLQNFLGINRSSQNMDASFEQQSIKTEPHQVSLQQTQSIENMKESRKSFDWVSDETLYPFGWKYKIMEKIEKGKSSYYHRLMSPSGKHFNGVRVALAHMIQNNFPELDISIMRAAMLENRWKFHDNLPQNWLYRSRPKATLFVDATGRLFEGKEAALKSLTKEDDITKLKDFQAPEFLQKKLQTRD